MNAFKKFAALLLALMMILSLAACGSKSDDRAQGSSAWLTLLLIY